MRAPLAVALLVLLATASAGCLEGTLQVADTEPLVNGVAEPDGWVDVHRATATVPLWVAVKGTRAAPAGAEQFPVNATPGFRTVVVEARWESKGPGPVNENLKLLFLAPDRTILAQVEGPSPLVLVLDAAAIERHDTYTAYAVGAENSVGVTKDQPYDLAVSFFVDRDVPEGYTALA